MKKNRLGKYIGDVVYFHRKYEGRMVPSDLLKKAKAALPDDFEYTYLKYDRKTGTISFMFSPDFDSANEPTVAAGYRVSGGEAKKIPVPKEADKQQIIHGKHLFVDDDYEGFDRDEAEARWNSYQGREGMDKSRMGRKGWWKSFMGENRVDKPDHLEVRPVLRSAIMEAVLLVTEGFSYTYKIPEDREKRLYDFYLFSLYYGYMFESRGKVKDSYQNRVNTLPGMGEDTVKDLEEIVQTSTKKLGDEIKEDLLDAMVTAVAAEFRHIWDANDAPAIQEFMEKQGAFEQFKKWARHYHRHLGEKKVPTPWKRTGTKREGSSKEYDAASKAVKTSGWEPDEFMKVAASAFMDLGWSSSYGGKAWNNIAKAWGKLNGADTLSERQIWIDHVFDLEHNTGTMLNKVERFKKSDGYGWIKKALDAKFDMTPIELARASSVPMSVVGRLNRLTGTSGTVEDHDKDKKSKEAREKFPDTLGPYKVKIVYDDDEAHIYINQDGFPQNKATEKILIAKDGDAYDMLAYGRGEGTPYETAATNSKKAIMDGLVEMGFLPVANAKEMVPEIQEIIKKLKGRSKEDNKTSDTVTLGGLILMKKVKKWDRVRLVPPSGNSSKTIFITPNVIRFWTNEGSDRIISGGLDTAKNEQAVKKALAKYMGSMLNQKMDSGDQAVYDAYQEIKKIRNEVANSPDQSNASKYGGWPFKTEKSKGKVVLTPEKAIGGVNKIIMQDEKIEVIRKNGSSVYDPRISMQIKQMEEFFRNALIEMGEKYDRSQMDPQEHADMIVSDLLKQFRSVFGGSPAKQDFDGWKFLNISLASNPGYGPGGMRLHGGERYDFAVPHGDILGVAVNWKLGYVAVQTEKGPKKFKSHEAIDLWNALEHLGSLRKKAYEKLYKKAFKKDPPDPMASSKDSGPKEETYSVGPYVLNTKDGGGMVRVDFAPSSDKIPGLVTLLIQKDKVVLIYADGKKAHFYTTEKGWRNLRDSLSGSERDGTAKKDIPALVRQLKKIYKERFPGGMPEPKDIIVGHLKFPFRQYVESGALQYDYSGYGLPIDGITINEKELGVKWKDGKFGSYPFSSTGADFREIIRNMLKEKQVSFSQEIANDLWKTLKKESKRLFS